MDDTINIIESTESILIEEVPITVSIEEATADIFDVSDQFLENIEIIEDTEDIIELVDAGISCGPVGPAGATGPQGPPGDSTPPSTATIIRTDGEISSIEYESGRTVTITRTDGEITSIQDDDITKRIVRENGEIIGVVING